MGPRHVLSFCAFTTAWLAPELLGSMGPSPHLWFLHAKQRLLDQSTSLLGYQTSPVVLCMQNSVICTRIKRLYVTWFAKIDHFPQKVILIYARSKCNGGAFFERELRVPFISRRNKLPAAAIWRSYVLPWGRYEPKSIDQSSRSGWYTASCCYMRTNRKHVYLLFKQLTEFSTSLKKYVFCCIRLINADENGDWHAYLSNAFTLHFLRKVLI